MFDKFFVIKIVRKNMANTSFIGIKNRNQNNSNNYKIIYNGIQSSDVTFYELINILKQKQIQLNLIFNQVSLLASNNNYINIKLKEFIVYYDDRARNEINKYKHLFNTLYYSFKCGHISYKQMHLTLIAGAQIIHLNLYKITKNTCINLFQLLSIKNNIFICK